jgi:hypothetical protein
VENEGAITTMTTEIAKEVMDPETKTDTLRAQEEGIIPIAKPRIQRKTATDADAMIVIDLVDMMTERGIGRGAEGIVKTDQGVEHLKLSGRGRGMGWQDQIDLGRGNVNEKEGIDGLHHLVDASPLF